MRVLALTRYAERGASSRVRTLQYAPLLREAGVELDVRPLLGDAYLARRYAGRGVGLPFLLRSYLARLAALARTRRYDLVWVEKELMPWAPGLVERGLLAATSYVVDYDDAVFHSYDLHRSPVVRRLWGRKVDAVMRGAALVLAGNPYLAERAERAGARRVAVLPSVVDLTRYGAVTPAPEGPFTIGWIGSPGSEALLERVRDVLAEEARQPGTRVALVGASPRALAGVPHETWAWSEATEVEHMRRFHVGIMPLADTPWERGKCGYKLIQCMGAGRPVVASPVGVNTEIVAEGESGFLARSPDDWRRAFREIRGDPERAAAMGRRGRETVERRYDLRRTAPRLAELLRSAAGDVNRGGS